MGNISSTPNNRCRHISHTRTSNNNNKIKVHYLIPMESSPSRSLRWPTQEGREWWALPRQSITLAKATNRIKGAGLIYAPILYMARDLTESWPCERNSTARYDPYRPSCRAMSAIRSSQSKSPGPTTVTASPQDDSSQKPARRCNPTWPAQHLAPTRRPLMGPARLQYDRCSELWDHFAAIGLDAPRRASTLALVIVLRLISRLNTWGVGRRPTTAFGTGVIGMERRASRVNRRF
jgi:hypothetical protein